MKRFLISVLIILSACGTGRESHQDKLRIWHPPDNLLVFKDTLQHEIYNNLKTIMIADTFDHITYVIDSGHTVIMRVNEKNQILWQREPKKYTGREYYRWTFKPRIARFRLHKMSISYANYLGILYYQKGEIVLGIQYGNSQFGVIDSTGLFQQFGQD